VVAGWLWCRGFKDGLYALVSVQASLQARAVFSRAWKELSLLTFRPAFLPELFCRLFNLIGTAFLTTAFLDWRWLVFFSGGLFGRMPF
jgi:hypothetical protein